MEVDATSSTATFKARAGKQTFATVSLAGLWIRASSVAAELSGLTLGDALALVAFLVVAAGVVARSAMLGVILEVDTIGAALVGAFLASASAADTLQVGRTRFVARSTMLGVDANVDAGASTESLCVATIQQALSVFAGVVEGASLVAGATVKDACLHIKASASTVGEAVVTLPDAFAVFAR